jgi:hypothetical protein
MKDSGLDGQGTRVEEVVAVKEYASPQELYDDFEWDESFATEEKCLPQFKNFLENDEIGRGLGVTGEEVWQALQTNFVLADDWYNTFFPNGEMKYHNAVHAKNTAAVAMKMFIARLARIKEEKRGVGWEDPAVTKQLVQTAAAVFALHEVDDWWGRGVDQDDPTAMDLLTTKKRELRDNLVKQGISLEDFERMLALGDFSKNYEEVLGQQLKEGGEKLLSGVKTDQKEEVARAFGSALNGADFAQICNVTYEDEVEIQAGDQKYKTMRGPAALAVEHSLYRNKALVAAGWSVSEEMMGRLDRLRDRIESWLRQGQGQRKDELSKLKKETSVRRINWEKVVWNEWFINELAIPKIQMGILDLNLFDSTESRNLWDRIFYLREKAKKSQ